MTSEQQSVYQPLNDYPINNEEITWRTATYDICHIETKHTHEELARAGFIWSSDQERPRCAYCHKLLSVEDENSEDLIERHISMNRDCPFLTPFTQQPVHEEWEDQIKRLSTLSDGHWPGATGLELSELGLFKCPATQRIMCFQCGAVFADWELWGTPDMMAWKLHAQKQRTCAYIIRKQGIDFVESSQAFESSSEDDYSLTDEDEIPWWNNASTTEHNHNSLPEGRLADNEEAIIDLDTLTEEGLRNYSRCKICLQNMSQVMISTVL